MYDVYLRLIGKRLVDFLLVITEHFLLGVMREALQMNIDWKLAFLHEWGQFDPKISGSMGRPTNHSSCRKTRM